MPYICELKWSINSRLRDIVHQFREHLENLQGFWSTMENIDRTLWVIDPRQPARSTSFRKINLGNDCRVVLSIDALDPRSLPECRFLGPHLVVDSMIKKWRRNSKRWMKDKPFNENLASTLEMPLPGPQDVQKDDKQVECGICYAQYLPVDDELGARSGSGPDYACENIKCCKAFHSVCLADWLRSITTTRQYVIFQCVLFGFELVCVLQNLSIFWGEGSCSWLSCSRAPVVLHVSCPLFFLGCSSCRSFNVLFGNCPYCSEPVAVKVNTKD